MTSRILVTGANGRVGRVLRRGLAGLEVTFTGRAEVDVNDSEALVRAMRGHDQVVHLADPLRVDIRSSEVLRSSVNMASSVLSGAKDSGVSRVIIPSSVMATSLVQLEGDRIVSVAESQAPETEYGRTRLEIEALGRRASESGLEVICLRLGAVRHPDFPWPRPHLRSQWLSHEDCAAVFRACLTAKVAACRFSLFYAVSDSPERVLDTANPFGWIPQTTRPGLKRTAVAGFHALNTGIRGRLQIRTRLKAVSNWLRN